MSENSRRKASFPPWGLMSVIMTPSVAHLVRYVLNRLFLQELVPCIPVMPGTDDIAYLRAIVSYAASFSACSFEFAAIWLILKRNKLSFRYLGSWKLDRGIGWAVLIGIGLGVFGNIWTTLCLHPGHLYSVLYLPAYFLTKLRMMYITLVVIVGVLVAPFAEELLFRGLAYCLLRRKLNTAMSVLLLSIGFVLCHINIYKHPGLTLHIFLLSVVVSLFYEKRRSIIGCIIIHLISNAIVLPA